MRCYPYLVCSLLKSKRTLLGSLPIAFSLISFRSKPNKATKVAPIVPTTSSQFQKSHFQSIENEQCLIEMTPVHASVTTTRIPTAIRHTIAKITLCCLLFSISSPCMRVLRIIFDTAL